jgi:gamma-glutamyltranspeptidase/glutathione hydrolase
VSSPRIHHQWQPDNVRYETGAISDAVAAELTTMGHKGLTSSRFGMGNANSIKIDNTIIEGVSDPREAGGVAGF